MAKKLKYDLRTPAEKKRDEECIVIEKRFRELMPCTPHPHRVFSVIAQELGLNRTCVRDRCIRMGLFTPGHGKGKRSNFTINL